MNNVAIRVEHISKRYRIGQLHGYKSLRETVAHSLSSNFRRLSTGLQKRSNMFKGSKYIAGTGSQKRSNYIWALQDVSFQVKCGEAVGIIGKNGSGKSTILKILARITYPTKGFIGINGRLGALLEMGSGFHPELTGRENIFFNGVLLGLSKADVERKFDEIVAFSEIEKFIDTPVKRYSTGMYIRLAFAVATQLGTDILLIDEVLAVGDAEFQKKCLGKIGEIVKEGCTILFVSHDMEAVAKLCPRTIFLQQGSIVMEGESQNVIQKYLAGTLEN